jgi:tripartite-type tricarboxylate transporter receptor subunit TctC
MLQGKGVVAKAIVGCKIWFPHGSVGSIPTTRTTANDTCYRLRGIVTELARSAGVPMTHVPYKGGPPVVQDLLAGQIAAALNVVSNVLPHVLAGRLRALATTAPKRSAVLPDVPTAREAGYPAMEGRRVVRALSPDRHAE